LKKILRKKLLDKRKKKYIEISPKQTFIISELIKNKYKNIKVIGGYIPINYEYDCLNLLRALKKKNYTICLPVIKKNFQMNFYKYSFKDPLRINRLGYGGGFYDRYFEKNSNRKKIVKIGLAFSFQKIKKLPINKFDKKLDRVITEKKI